MTKYKINSIIVISMIKMIRKKSSKKTHKGNRIMIMMMIRIRDRIRVRIRMEIKRAKIENQILYKNQRNR